MVKSIMLNFLLCLGTTLFLPPSEGLVCFNYANNTRSIEKCSTNTTECYTCPLKSLQDQPQGGCHSNPLVPSLNSSHNPKFNHGLCRLCKWDLCNSVAMIVEPIDTGWKVEEPPTSYLGYYIAGGAFILVVIIGCLFGIFWFCHRQWYRSTPPHTSATNGNDHEMNRLTPAQHSDGDPPLDQNGTTSP